MAKRIRAWKVTFRSSLRAVPGIAPGNGERGHPLPVFVLPVEPDNGRPGCSAMDIIADRKWPAAEEAIFSVPFDLEGAYRRGCAPGGDPLVRS